jgi:hypothetical protein
MTNKIRLEAERQVALRHSLTHDLDFQPANHSLFRPIGSASIFVVLVDRLSLQHKNIADRVNSTMIPLFIMGVSGSGASRRRIQWFPDSFKPEPKFSRDHGLHKPERSLLGLRL